MNPLSQKTFVLLWFHPLFRNNLNHYYSTFQSINMYPIDLVAHMSQELVEAGFESLETPAEVDAVLDNQKGTVLLVVNSVCGCAARNARPAAISAIHNDKKPMKLATVFAGQHLDATAKAREYLFPYPPSSPSMGLFKDGKLVHFIERHHIEGRPAELIAANLKMAFDAYC